MDQMLIWLNVCSVTDIQPQAARVIETALGPIAVFRTLDDHIFALYDECPHKRGPLSQGIVHGHAVTCPLHNWVIDLATGAARGPDVGCSGAIPVRVDEGRVFLKLAKTLTRKAANG